MESKTLCSKAGWRRSVQKMQELCQGVVGWRSNEEDVDEFFHYWSRGRGKALYVIGRRSAKPCGWVGLLE